MIAASIHQGLVVVRDDLRPGGTKTRAIAAVLYGSPDQVAYAGPAYGYAQIALAHGARAAGKTAHVFVAKRQQRHPRTVEAQAAGAVVHEISPGYLSQTTAAARAWAEENDAAVLPFGFDTPAFERALAFDIATDIDQALPDPPDDDPDLAARINTLRHPREVWVAAGSGTVSRALQRVWPEAEHHAVQIGKTPDAGRATIHTAPERFEADARQPPPYPSTPNYDAKVWQFVSHRADPEGRLIWNVAG